MPDWRVSEFEVNFKDEFARSNSRVVQNQGNEHVNGVGALNITNKKLKHEVDNGKSPQGVISERNNVESRKCNSECIQTAVGLVAQDANLTDECIGDRKVEPDAFTFCGKNSVSETRDPTDNSNSCHFTLNNASPVVNNLSILQSGLGYGENDLPYYDWPDIDNFEDVDTLFRKCDFTYGQQQMENTNEVSWLPSSSDAIYSSNVALQPGLQSSYSEYDVLNDLSAYHCPENKLLPTTDPSAVVCDKQFNDDCPFGVDLVDAGKEERSYSEQAYQGDTMEVLPTDQTCNGHGINGYENLDMIGSQCLSENVMEQLTNQNFSLASASQLSPAENVPKQKHPLDSTSSSYVTSKSYPENNCHFSPAGASFAERTSKVQKKVGKLRQRQLISDNVVAGQPSQQTLRRASQPGQNHRSPYETEHNGLEKRSLEVPTAGMDSSMVVDSSFISSISSDNSPEENSFRQLQDAINQLDVKTKLCIRDSLYRLARSAQHRQVLPNAINSNGESEDAKEFHSAETSRKFVEPLNVETQTNPIDRSIALLLFHQPSDHVAGAVDDATSLKSHVCNEHRQGPTENQGAAPALLYSPRSLGGSRNVKSRENY